MSLTGGYSTPRERRERAENDRLAEIQAKQFQEVQSIEASMEASLRKRREAAARVSMGLAFAHLLSERNPGVAKSDVVLLGDKTIYHVRDWHYVTREALSEVEGIEGDKLYASQPEIARR